MDYNLPPYFRLAQKARLLSDFQEKSRKMGAVVIQAGKVISVGANYRKSHPKFANFSKCWTIHAEINAIIRAGMNLDGSSIYIYREAIIDGIVRPALAKPCDSCLAALIDAKFWIIRFTTNTHPYWEQIEL